jgi:adenylate kinase family enzyme
MDPWPFSRRDDDTEATKAHLETHRKEKGSLKSHYEVKDLLTVLDASRPMGEVTAEILEALGHPERPEYYASCQRV